MTAVDTFERPRMIARHANPSSPATHAICKTTADIMCAPLFCLALCCPIECPEGFWNLNLLSVVPRAGRVSGVPLRCAFVMRLCDVPLASQLPRRAPHCCLQLARVMDKLDLSRKMKRL